MHGIHHFCTNVHLNTQRGGARQTKILEICQDQNRHWAIAQMGKAQLKLVQSTEVRRLPTRLLKITSTKNALQNQKQNHHPARQTSGVQRAKTDS